MTAQSETTHGIWQLDPAHTLVEFFLDHPVQRFDPGVVGAAFEDLFDGLLGGVEVAGAVRVLGALHHLAEVIDLRFGGLYFILQLL